MGILAWLWTLVSDGYGHWLVMGILGYGHWLVMVMVLVSDGYGYWLVMVYLVMGTG